MCASSSTSATVGAARQDASRSISLEGRRRGSVTAARGSDLEARRAAPAVCWRPCVSTNPTTTSVPRSAPAVALVEHRVRLADARARRRGRRAAAAAIASASPLRAGSAGRASRFSSQHVDAAPRGSRGCGRSVSASTSGAHLGGADAAGLRDPRRPGAGRTPGLMSGSSPLPLAVTASAGTAGVGRGVAADRRDQPRGCSPRRTARTPPATPPHVGHERRGRAGLVQADDAGHRPGEPVAAEDGEHRADAVGRAVRPAAVDALQLRRSRGSGRRPGSAGSACPSSPLALGSGSVSTTLSGRGWTAPVAVGSYPSPAATAGTGSTAGAALPSLPVKDWPIRRAADRRCRLRDERPVRPALAGRSCATPVTASG